MLSSSRFRPSHAADRERDRVAPLHGRGAAERSGRAHCAARAGAVEPGARRRGGGVAAAYRGARLPVSQTPPVLHVLRHPLANAASVESVGLVSGGIVFVVGGAVTLLIAGGRDLPIS